MDSQRSLCAVFHFETQEELMKRCGYNRAEPREADAHLQEHRKFSRRLAARATSTLDGS